MKSTEFVNNTRGRSHVVILQPLAQNFLPSALYFLAVSTQNSLDLALGLRRTHKVDPFGFGMLRLGSEDFYLVATLELMAHRHQFVVDLGSDTMRAKESMDSKSKIKCGTICRHCLDFTFGRENEDFTGKEVELDGIEKVHRVGLRIIKDLLYGAQPVVQLIVIIALLVMFLIFPMGGKSLFGNFVHSIRPDLYLNPLARS